MKKLQKNVSVKLSLRSKAGANPTIASYNASVVNFYNASVVNFYNATGSLARLENKTFYSTLKNALSSLLQCCRCNCKFKSRSIGS
jgi:hypothetical protein